MPATCRQCDHELPTAARRCPNCGNPLLRTDIESIGERKTADDEVLPGEEPFSPPPRQADEAGRQIDDYAPLQFDEPPAAAPGDPAGAARNESRERPLDLAADSLMILSSDNAHAAHTLMRPYYSIGRGQSKIRLDDPRVSRWHLALVRLGTDWVVINRTENRSMQVGGWNLRQKTLDPADVIGIGETWLVFVPARARSAVELPRGNPATGLAATLPSLNDEDDAALLVLSADVREAARSSGRPLLIGSHSACDVITAGSRGAPFHAFISWLADGPMVNGLGSAVLLNGRPVKRALLSNGDRLKTGDMACTVEIRGDSQLPFRRRQERIRQVPLEVHLTSFYGRHAGRSLPLVPGVWTSIGRAESCDLSVPRDRRVADRQAEIMVDARSLDDSQQRPVLRVRDVSGTGTTLINRKPVAGTQPAAIGDVLQFGRPDDVAGTALIVHYPLASDSWLMEHDS